MLSTRFEPGVATFHRLSDSKQLLLEVAPVELFVMLLASALVGALLVILYQRLSQRRDAEASRLKEEADELTERARGQFNCGIHKLSKPAPRFTNGTISLNSLDFHH